MTKQEIFIPFMSNTAALINMSLCLIENVTKIGMQST